MLEFRDIDIRDKDRITTALRKSQFMGCEYSFSNNMAWKRLGDSLSTRIFISAVHSGQKMVSPVFSFLQVKVITMKSFLKCRNIPKVSESLSELRVLLKKH